MEEFKLHTPGDAARMPLDASVLDESLYSAESGNTGGLYM